ncbi:ER membrane protein complex subunit 2-A-like [Hordeum vulgare]|nr:ER membrane protein complex subunit 2-A-like [Hordeum vulgare]
MEVVASVPGKVLVAGGYLVLERPNTGLVLSTTSHFYAIVRPTTAAEEEAHLLRLEEKAEHGGGGAWEYLSLACRLRARHPAPVLRLGLSLLNDASARSRIAFEHWTLYEKVAVATMDF